MIGIDYTKEKFVWTKKPVMSYLNLDLELYIVLLFALGRHKWSKTTEIVLGGYEWGWGML